jgi:DNA-binding TFAR19-related protein (PDSD5 family)
MSKSFKANKTTNQTASKKALIKQALNTSAARRLKRTEWS